MNSNNKCKLLDIRTDSNKKQRLRFTANIGNIVRQQLTCYQSKSRFLTPRHLKLRKFWKGMVLYVRDIHTHTHPFTALFWDNPGEPVPEENFWTLWCKGRLTEADTPTIRLGATPSGLTCAHLRHPPILFTGGMPFLSHNQQCQSTEGNLYVRDNTNNWTRINFAQLLRNA